MSSSISQGKGKLLVHIAENGHSFQFDCYETTPVDSVMRYIESVAGINVGDQLVLCLDMRLESQRPLSAYGLPANDKEVFIFNKARLQSNAPLPPLEQVDLPEVLDPPSPASPHNSHPLDDSALPSYLTQFMYHYHKGHAIYSHSKLKYEHCERLLGEQKVQERAVEVAKGSLEHYYRIINQNYLEFMKRYAQQYRIHSDFMSNFGRDIEKLRSMKLHPALQTATRRTLADFVKEDNLRKSVENCTSSHKQFGKKVSDFKHSFAEVKRKVEELFSCRPSLAIRNLELAIKEHQQLINEQKSIMQSLRKDATTVKSLVDDCLSCESPTSLRPHDAVSALGPMHHGHEKDHLPKMQDCDYSISKLLEFCTDKKNEMNVFVQNYVQKITYVTYIIKDIKLQFPVFKEAMVRQDDLFTDLKLVRGIGSAYRACLAEVVRRKASMKFYMGLAGQLAERLAGKREDEIRKREEFLKAHSLYIPNDILGSMGLYDTPSQCDVNIAPFDTHLLDIDISDLDRYAPEHLLALPGKIEKHALRSSYSMSNDSSQSAEAEDITFDSLEKDDSEELLEGSELVEIAGTSKMEVENAKLKAELASDKALICSLRLKFEYESLDDSKVDSLLKDAAEKTTVALHQKDEYEKHLQSLLKAKKMQCLAYEKRIQELEQKLSDRYSHGQKLVDSKDVSEFAVLAENAGNKPSSAEAQIPYISTSEPMDEVSCISNSFDAKLGLLAGQPGKARDVGDENMMDLSGMLNPLIDSSMMEQHREELQICDKEVKDKMVGQLGMSLAHSSTAESMPQPPNVLPRQADSALDSKVHSDHVIELQNALSDKTNQLSDTETKLKAALEEVLMLTRELEMSRKLLDESQMNCAHLENCLHEAREEAQTHLCAADRRASDSVNENEDDVTAEFQKCIRVLADKVNFLSRHREELLDKYPKLEAANEQLRKELEDKKELVKTLYTKHQLEKQANKEKISFGRLEVHEIAAFVLNAADHYEAINRNCSNYYLSAESVALFADHLPSRPRYIVGQIVHIERQTVKPPHPPSRQERRGADQVENMFSETRNEQLTLNSGTTFNPYGLPVGCEYFVVTVAMLPDTAIHSTSS
ncbi:autophagy-related protein 11 isoform X2 [Tripterygium wilfordii]|uniref:autophagy-related protein 11 isoform X2 n=1 Tax=Tripterygium wilfordii TaxID=458696 RepID=UPI0018F85041|nr:autophagy-related protein 11 isoform X2 [Tripterygium wilfordii]